MMDFLATAVRGQVPRRLRHCEFDPPLLAAGWGAERHGEPAGLFLCFHKIFIFVLGIKWYNVHVGNEPFVEGNKYDPGVNGSCKAYRHAMGGLWEQ